MPERLPDLWHLNPCVLCISYNSFWCILVPAKQDLVFKSSWCFLHLVLLCDLMFLAAAQAQIKELKETLQQTGKDLQEERSEHQMMKLRAEKQVCVQPYRLRCDSVTYQTESPD